MILEIEDSTQLYPSSFSFLDVSYDCRKLLTSLVHPVQFDAVFAGNEAEERREREITLLTCENFWSRICCLRFMGFRQRVAWLPDGKI